MNLKLLPFFPKRSITIFFIFFTAGIYSQVLRSVVNDDVLNIDQKDLSYNDKAIASLSTELISSGSNWKYLDNGSDQGTNWRSVSYNDSAWQAGNAELGYRDGGEETIVGYGPSANNKFITTYFRKEFNVKTISADLRLELNLIRDDGAVVYLNGTEVYRDNMPSGNILYTTLANTAIGTASESVFINADISTSALLIGENTIAVEIHQQNLSNPDISFDLRLQTLAIVHDPNTFAVIGDYGSNYIHEAAVASLVKSWNPNFIITTGDNNYPNGAASTIDVNIGKYYHDYIYPYTGTYGNGSDINRFFPSLGNHDAVTSLGAPYYQYFTLPGNERYYDFIKGDIHFFVLNSEASDPSGNSSTSVQAMWLKNKLAASASKWKIVYFHYSPYCSDAVHGSQTVMRWPFSSWGADAVITGHSHIYERVLINNFPYFVNGLGGMSKYSLNSTPVAGSKIRYNSNFGAMKVTVKPDTIWCRFYNINNILIDAYPIVKSSATPPPECKARITAGGATTFCAGGSVTLSTNVVAGRSYQWKKNGVNIAGATNSSYQASSAGDYQLKISSLGCTDWSALTKVTINSSLVAKINASGPTTFCNGNNVTLYANTCNGYIYQWKKNGANISGATSSFYTATTSGSYQVKIILGASVAWSANVSVTVNSCGASDSVMAIVDQVPLESIPENDVFGINVFPNPTTGLFTFELFLDDIQETEIYIDVLSPLGQIVYSRHEGHVSGNIKETIGLDNNLSTGIYVLRLTIGEKTENIRVMLSR